MPMAESTLNFKSFSHIRAFPYEVFLALVAGLFPPFPPRHKLLCFVDVLARWYICSVTLTSALFVAGFLSPAHGDGGATQYVDPAIVMLAKALTLTAIKPMENVTAR